MRFLTFAEMAPRKILCVAEKPSIAKAVAQHLSGGNVNTVSLICDHGFAYRIHVHREMCLVANISRITNSTSLLASHGAVVP